MKNSALAVLMQPLAISELGLRALVAAAQSPPTTTVSTKPAAPTQSGVAVIDVDGPLSKDESIWQALFGGSSYAGVRRQLAAAVGDADVSAVVLNIDSPGGEVYGCGELADAIYAARSAKPVYAYIGGQGDSAAYWIASAADEVIINASGEAGSIGVRCVMFDDSKLQDAIGIKSYDIVSSQSPHKVANAAKSADRARIQEQMTAFASVFVADVARNRGVTVSTVLKNFGQGDVFVGAAAVKAGLADRVGTLESVVAELSAHAGDTRMKIQHSKTPIVTVDAQKVVAALDRLTPEQLKIVKKTGGDPAKAAAHKVEIDALVKGDDSRPRAPGAELGLTPEELEIIKKTGGDPVRAAKQKARLHALRNGIVDGK